jgi:peroxin-5
MMMAAQQQQQMMMAQQQHQHMMMVQQQQQQQLGRMQQQKVAAANMASHQQQELKRVEDDVVTIGDEEENVRHDEEEEGYRGHEGESRPVRIEELAAAWAEAQAEYEELEAAVNLAAAHGYGEDDPDADAAIAYEFVNQVSTELERKTDSHEDPNYMEEGMSHFASGNLTEAIRAFEMELQVRGSDNAAAWTMLGRCHAENDQDQAAIACLQQAAERDPTSPEARLALGVSQVNELQHAAALRNLKAWITSNPKYAGIVKDSPESFLGPAGDEGEGLEEAFNEVQRLLLQALSVEADPDVLEALGVVYNVSRDYEAAVDAFTRAIALQPDSYQLYNRLGATLANCSQSDKALPMYKRALELRPKYARAWLNSAISFSNLQSYDDAARCYLQTLSLNPSAMHCWSYLRIALSCSEKWDLIPFAAAMDLQAFKDHYDFVLYK